jgi:hypothetical protein
MITNLQNLKAGTPFRLQGTLITGTLIDCNECSAKVRLSGRPVDFDTSEPCEVLRAVTSLAKSTIWSPATVVETMTDDAAATSPAADSEPTCETCGAVTDRDHIGPICPACSEANDEDEPMKTVTKAKKAPKAKLAPAAKAAKPVKAVKPAPADPKKDHPKPKAKAGMSLLDAAADVLSDGKPRNCEQIISEVLSRKLWNTSGKTPAATLYSAMHREITKPDGNSRFQRTDHAGQFKIAGQTSPPAAD